MSPLSFTCEWNLYDLSAGFNLSGERSAMPVFQNACGDEWFVLVCVPSNMLWPLQMFFKENWGMFKKLWPNIWKCLLRFVSSGMLITELSMGAAQTFADWCPLVVGVAVLNLYTDMEKLVRWETLVYVHAVLVLCFSAWHGKKQSSYIRNLL